MTVCLEKTPVAWLERDYDHWHTKRTVMVSGTGGEYVAISCYPDQNTRMRPGPSHHQPVILLKDDLDHDWTDEDARHHYNCWQCPNSLTYQSNGHRCAECEAPIMHMMGSTCLRCADDLWNPARDVARQNERAERHNARVAHPAAAVQVAESAQADVPVAPMVSGLRYSTISAATITQVRGS